MQNHLKFQPLRADRSNLLAQERPSSVTVSGHTDAAGLLLQQPSSTPFGVPSSITTVRPESPREITCAVKKNRYNIQQSKDTKVATASRLVQHDAHAAKMRELSKGSTAKKARRWESGNERLTCQGRNLLKRLEKNGEYLKKIRPYVNSSDPLEAWFFSLGLPCHPGRVRQEQNPLYPSAATRGEDVGEDDSDSGTEDELMSLRDDPIPLSKAVDVKYTATASTITPDQLNKFLRWKFVSAKRDAPAKVEGQTNPAEAEEINPYHKEFQYDKRRTWAIHDITAPVQCSLRKGTNETLLLERKITQFLSEEHDRIRKGFTKLPYPTAWLAALRTPEPPKYHIPLEYANFVAEQSEYLFKRKEKCRAADAQSSSSGRSDRTIVPRKAGLTFRSDTTGQGETQGMEKLLSEHRFYEGDTEDTKREKANTLNKKVQQLNIPWKRHNAVVTLDSTIHRMLRRPNDVLRVLPQEDIKLNDHYFADGDTMFNWDATDHLQFEPYIIEKFLTFPGCPALLPSEGKVEKIVGNLLTDIVVGAGMTERNNAPLPFPKHLKAVGTNPSPDIYVRATSGLDWTWNILPVLFAGECKPIIRYSIWKPRAQLAMAFHGTLISLILYYLDTRDDVHSALPPWLFLYGIEYMERGVVIHAHYPSYTFDGHHPGGGYWTLQASLVSDHFSNVFDQNVDASERVRLLAVLFRIRSHSLYVLKQLKQWTRGPDVLSVLVTESNPTSPDSVKSKGILRTEKWVQKARIASNSGVDEEGLNIFAK